MLQDREMRRLSAVFSPVKCAVARALLRGHYSAEKPLFIGFFLDGGPYMRGPRVRAYSAGCAFRADLFTSANTFCKVIPRVSNAWVRAGGGERKSMKNIKADIFDIMVLFAVARGREG